MDNLSHVKGPEKEGQRKPDYYPTRADYIEGTESIAGSTSDDVQEQLDSLTYSPQLKLGDSAIYNTCLNNEVLWCLLHGSMSQPFI